MPPTSYSDLLSQGRTPTGRRAVPRGWSQWEAMQNFYGPRNDPNAWTPSVRTLGQWPGGVTGGPDPSVLSRDLGGFSTGERDLAKLRIITGQGKDGGFGGDPTSRPLTPEEEEWYRRQMQLQYGINPPPKPQYGVDQLSNYGVGALKSVGMGAVPQQQPGYGPLLRRRR